MPPTYPIIYIPTSMVLLGVIKKPHAPAAWRH